MIVASAACAFMVACDFINAKDDDAEAYYEDMALCVKIVDHGGANYTDEPRYNAFEIERFDGVVLPGAYTVDFSIADIQKDRIVISFKDNLLRNGEEVSEIRLEPGESIELRTKTGDEGSAYTFFITDWSDINDGTPYGA